MFWLLPEAKKKRLKSDKGAGLFQTSAQTGAKKPPV